MSRIFASSCGRRSNGILHSLGFSDTMAERPVFPVFLSSVLGSSLFCAVLLVGLGLGDQVRAQTAAPEVARSAIGPSAVMRETHGAWQVFCHTPPGAKEEKCALVQSVTAEDRPNVGLSVLFFGAIAEDKKLLRVMVPLGVLLPQGLGLRIDGEDVGNVPFLNCSRRGCAAEALLQDEIIAKMKKGKTAVFIFFITPEEGIGIPVALEGFSKALASLK